jgi:uncharacterized membrane protein YhaH (DUF805 family)
MGALQFRGYNQPAFDLDAELSWQVSIPALFSAGLLFAAAMLALARARQIPDARRRGWVAIGAFLTFMGIDEMVEIHERLERVTEIDWQTLYVPIALIGAVAWFVILKQLWRHRSLSIAWIAGAGAWLIAQVLEDVQWGPGDVLVSGAGSLIVAEETLEMSGSALFLLTLLAIRRSERPTHRSGELRP